MYGPSLRRRKACGKDESFPLGVFLEQKDLRVESKIFRVIQVDVYISLALHGHQLKYFYILI